MRPLLEGSPPCKSIPLVCLTRLLHKQPATCSHR